jgi:hypothetical protein
MARDAGTESNSDLLSSRYGHTPRSGRQQRIWAITGVAGVAIVLIAWLWWAGLAQPTAQFETRDLGYELISDQEVIVKFEVSAPPGTQVNCAVQALNASYGIVGWQVLEIPASDQRTRVFNQPVRTSEQAVTGLLYQCWVP